ncbi:MAG: hypothetical protein ABIZ81_13180 [Opitutaceae bacterium]
MKKLFYTGALVAFSFFSLPSIQAAYNPALVGSDARWVVYADLNALRESTLGKELMTAVSQAQSQATGGVIGVDVPKLLATVGSLTAYGSNLTADPAAIDGTLIAQGTADLRKIAESVLLQGTLAQPEVFSEVTGLSFPAYAIGSPAPKGAASTAPKMELIVAFPPEPIIIVSKSKAQLLRAREVFRGSAPSLARSGASAFGKLGAMAEGAYLFAATLVPSDPIFPEKSPQTRVLQLTNSGALAFGERGADTFANIELVASSEANAERLMKILQGLTAVLSMAETNNRELGEFLKATAVTQEKDAVRLRLAYPSARLVQMAQTLQTRTEARPQPANNRPSQPITIGQVLAEWGGETAPAAATLSDTSEVGFRTVENVALTNGMVITVGRAQNGAKDARIDRVEIMAAAGSGTPLVWRQEFMRSVGGRGTMWQFPFPGVTGLYTLKVGYVNPPDSKAKFAVSTGDAKAAAPAAGSGKGPLIPQPKLK